MEGAMGLDMYLMQVQVDRNVAEDEFFDLSKTRVENSPREIGYWRKANQIHAWMVDNIQGGKDDQRDYPLSIERIRLLKRICRLALDNPTLRAELLPTRSGFFFGSADYDEGYIGDLERTIKIMDRALYEYSVAPNVVFYYTSWW
jgi:hypothetical protein